eukprot:scaffold6691_cov18-Tisochrysis_lutea.AAC.1
MALACVSWHMYPNEPHLSFCRAQALALQCVSWRCRALSDWHCMHKHWRCRYKQCHFMHQRWRCSVRALALRVRPSVAERDSSSKATLWMSKCCRLTRLMRDMKAKYFACSTHYPSSGWTGSPRTPRGLQRWECFLHQQPLPLPRYSQLKTSNTQRIATDRNNQQIADTVTTQEMEIYRLEYWTACEVANKKVRWCQKSAFSLVLTPSMCPKSVIQDVCNTSSR